MNFLKKMSAIIMVATLLFATSVELSASTEASNLYDNYYIMKVSKRDSSKFVEEFDSVDSILKNALLAAGSQNGGSFFSTCSQDDSCQSSGLNDASQAMLNTFVNEEDMLMENYQYLEGLGYDGFPTYISSVYDTYTDENGDTQIKIRYIMNNIDVTDRIANLNPEDFPGINISDIQARLDKEPIPGIAYNVLSDGSLSVTGSAGGDVALDLTPNVDLNVNGDGKDINIDIGEELGDLNVPDSIQDGIDAINGDLPDSSADELGDFLFGGE